MKKVTFATVPIKSTDHAADLKNKKILRLSTISVLFEYRNISLGYIGKVWETSHFS